MPRHSSSEASVTFGRCFLPALLAALALVAALAPAVSAHPLAHPSTPRVLNPRPAPGQVVEDGTVTIAGLAVAGADITGQRLVVDGAEVASSRAGDSPTHQTVTGTLDLASGDHIAEFTITDARGRSASRAWRFSVSGLALERLSGDSRVATAVAISRDLYPGNGSAGAVVLARADDFPDALAGVPFASAVDAPLLLSARDELSPPTADELRRVLRPGATVYLLGGTSALSDAVAAQVAQLGFVPERLRGDDRYATAGALADRLPDAATAVVVSGETFADALSVSSPAARAGYPILLTAAAALPEATRAELAEGGYELVIVVGGTKAVSPEAFAEIEAVVGAGNVARVAGPSRYDTAEAVAKTFFPQPPATVAVANGDTFPDALAGGRHAAALGAPLALTTTERLLAPQVSQVGAAAPTQVVVYGGEAAVGPGVLGDLRRVAYDGDGPRLVSVTPDEGVVVSTLDQVVLEFDRELVVEHSQVYASIGDNEVAGSIAIGDFPSTLVFNVAELPPIAPGVVYDVDVVGAVFDGSNWRHFNVDFALRKLDLSRGDAGPLVVELQQRLEANGYWIGAPDGVYGGLTHQAVLAVQKVHGLQRTGVYNERTRQILESNPARPAPRSSAGLVMEVDKARQVLLMVRNGTVEQIFNTSTGTEKPYTYEGQSYLADTPPGRWRITRQIDGVREGNLGILYRPKYFHPDGIAIHGSSSVPAFPASHGCVRVSNAAIDWLWAGDRMPIGTSVWIY
jgi:putative cell wall-binding protein